MKRVPIRFPQTRDIVIFWWLFKRCFQVSWIYSSLYILLSVIQTTLGILTYYATAKVSAELVRIVADNGNSKVVWHWLLLVGIFSILANAAFRLNVIIQRELYFLLNLWATHEYVKQLSRIDIGKYYDHTTRNLINRLNDGLSWQVPNAAYDTLLITESWINMLMTVVTVGLLVWWLIPLFFVLLIPAVVYEGKISTVSWYAAGEQGDERHLYYSLYWTFTSAKRQFEIRALSAAKRLIERLYSLSKKLLKRERQLLHKYDWLAAIAVLAQVIRELGAQAWLITLVIARKMTIEQYFFYVSMVFRLDGAISGTFSTMARMKEEMKFAMDFQDFLSIEPEIVDKTDAIIVANEPPTIEFVDATFTYPGATAPAFTHLSLTIRAGTKLALVGANGAGKSTIIKLLLRFYALDSGQLKINGVNIVDISIDSLLKQLAVLFQDFNQYSLTAEENIAISSRKTSGVLVREAAEMSNADSFIRAYPEGYKTYLDPAFKNGIEPSGGQWQRIALARAFYRKANMIILDEPTSAIDAKAEYEIFNNIFKEHDGKTALIVSHRFSTVRKADRIVVLDQGKVFEDGTHEDLIKLDGKYAEMFNKQAEGYR